MIREPGREVGDLTGRSPRRGRTARFLRWAGILCLTVGTAGLGCKDLSAPESEGDEEAAAAAGDTVTMEIEDFAFVAPDGSDTLAIEPGQTVRFVNRDAAPHTATSTSAPQGASFDSGRLGVGDEWFWTPASGGEWVYRCDFHPEAMKGARIRVTGGEDDGNPPEDEGEGGEGDENEGDGDDGDGDEGASLTDTVEVELVDFAFVAPDGDSTVEVSRGQTIRFVNKGEADHTATSSAGPNPFDSGNMEPGDAFHWTPAETGDWTLQCDYHVGKEMVGAISVTGDGSDGEGDPGDGSGDDASDDVVQVAITGSGFEPLDVTIELGQTVEWVNEGAVVHTASATSDHPDGGARFESGELRPGEKFRFRPDRTGTWEYRCEEHSDEAHGTLIVR